MSPGCAHCYADSLAGRFGKDIWGKGKPREDHRKNARKLARKLQKRSKAQVEAGGRRLRVFCSSMADLFDPEVPIEWLADALDDIWQMPDCDVLLLTKRPELWRRRMQEVWLTLRQTGPDSLSLWLAKWLGSNHADVGFEGQGPANVWIGTSVEDQKRADERIPALLKIPARVRFLSCEPLLEKVDLVRSGALGCDCPDIELENGEIEERCSGKCQFYKNSTDPLNRVGFVIVGGESGPNARPMHPDWARSLRDQCQAAGVPFFFKQWGEWAPFDNRDVWTEGKPLVCLKPSGETSWFAGDADGGCTNWSENYDESDQPISKVGKKAAGRTLDGREWNELPKANQYWLPKPTIKESLTVEKQTPERDERTADSALSASPGSEIDEHDPMNDPEYHAYLEVLAKDCKCAEKPCDGCMAGAPCDADTYGDGLEGWGGAE